MGRGQNKRSEGACDSGGGIWSCSIGGDDLIPKLAANGHQQSIEQCTAAQTRVPLTSLCQSVNTALANYNLAACNLRLSKLCRRSITLPPLSRSTPRAVGSKSVWRSPVSQWTPLLSWLQHLQSSGPCREWSLLNETQNSYDSWTAHHRPHPSYLVGIT